MSGSIRRLIAAAALALPPVFATCSKSTSAPKIPAILVRPYLGDSKVGLAGYAVNIRPAVTVTDSVGNAVFGASVTFAVASGGGSGTRLTATTDGNGMAQVGSWVLGASAGVNTMTASVTATGFTGSQWTFTDTAFAADYTITVQPYGAGLPPAAQTAFTAAAAKWQQIIWRHLTTVAPLNVPAGTCGPNTPAYNSAAGTSGIVILASADSIDGPGKTLAQAGPCEVRTSNGLTVFGVMKFDSADIGTLSQATLNSVVLHEMGHVLGFGSLWGPPTPPVQANCIQLQSNPPGTIQDTYFSCPKAQAAFDSIAGASYTGATQGPPAGGNRVPVENCATNPYVSPNCGLGTVNSHWREVALGTELMTGYINASVANPLSVISVAAQEDLGYTVNYAAADAYSHTFAAPPAARGAPLWLGDNVRHGPLFVVDARGAVVRVIPPR